MNSRAVILNFLVLFVLLAFAEEAPKDEPKEVAQNFVAKGEPKQVNQGGGGGGGGGCGYGRFRWCCGFWHFGRCNRWCCRADNGELEVEIADVEPQDVGEGGVMAAEAGEPKQINQGGGGGCGYGRFRWCCGFWHFGRCNRWCCRAENGAAVVEPEDFKQANEVHPENNYADNVRRGKTTEEHKVSKENQANAGTKN